VNAASPAAHKASTRDNWESNWNEFRSALDDAIASVPNEYFRIRRYGDDDPEPRERAYCYELYHQLRLRLRKDFPYALHAEVDKAGHAAIVRCFGPNARPNPDFILHKPTLMDCGDNLGIIEVKASDETRTAVGKDLCKIQKFLKRVGYIYGVMLFFGTERPKAFAPLKGIEFLWHRDVARKPLVGKHGHFD
jgi:hypothetical protein